MPPTPITQDGLLEVSYNVDSLIHKTRLFCHIQSEAGNDSLIANSNVPASPYTISDAAQILWDLMAVLYPTSVTAPDATLFKRDENIYVPVGVGSTTGAGTNSSPYQPGGQLTLTFKSNSQFLVRLQLAEASAPVPQRGGHTGQPSTIQDIFDSMTTFGVDPALNDFVTARNASFIQRGLFWTTTLNREIRRRRGFA